VRELARSGPLADRIAKVRAALAAAAGCPAGGIDARVAASAAHLGLAGRLIAPAVGVAVLRRGGDLSLADAWWQDELGGPFPLSVPLLVSGDRSRGDWHRELLGEVIAPLTEGVARLGGVSGQVLWGNVASAVNAAANQAARARPQFADAAWQAAGVLFATPWLSRERQRPGPAYRRSSCCLFYRLSPGGPRAVCGDCVLVGARRTGEQASPRSA
jgi:FhuF-like iron-sulfur protein